MRIFICGKDSGGGTVTNDMYPTGPWAPQIPYVNQLFSEAGKLYQQGGQKYYPKDTVAGVNPQLQQSWGDIGRYSQQGSGMALNGQMAALNAAQGNAYSPTLQLAQGYQPAMTGGIAGSLGVNQAQGQVLGRTAGNTANALNANLAGAGTQANVGFTQTDAAGQNLNSYLSNALSGQGTMNPYLEQLVQGQAQTATRAFNDNVLPSIRGEAGAAGQPGGTRAGIAEGIATSRLGEDITNITNQLYSNAFDRGLETQNTAAGLVGNSQDSRAQQQLQAQELGINSGIQRGQLANQAAQTAGQFGQGASQGYNQMSGMLGDLFSNGGAQNAQLQGYGMSSLPNMIGAQGNVLQMGNQQALQRQDYNQAVLQSGIDRWNFNQNRPYDALGAFQNFISGGYGSSIAGGKNQTVDQTTGLPPTGSTGQKDPNQMIIDIVKGWK